MTKRTVITHDLINEILTAKSSADIRCYMTPSAAWIYNMRRKLVKLVVLDSDGMTNDIIYYDRSSKHFLTHAERILRLTA